MVSNEIGIERHDYVGGAQIEVASVQRASPNAIRFPAIRHAQCER